MNYKIITDIEKLEQFINWLPNLEKDEVFYFALFARKKYLRKDQVDLLKSDKAQLARGTATKDRLISKIKKLEVPLGTYTIGDKPVPENTLALYITPNPRCLRRASLKTAKMVLEDIDKGRVRNPKAIAMDAIQVSKSKTFIVDFDFDIVNENYDKHIGDIVYEATGNEDCFNILKTRGGYHVLVDPSLATDKKWYQNLTKNNNIDQTGDLLLPVAGCIQGGSTPKFI